MRVKTSVTLRPELIEAVDRHRGPGVTRSEFLERAAWLVIRRKQREERDRRDLRIYNEHADELNAEAADVQAMQDAWAALAEDHWLEEDPAVVTRVVPVV